MERYDQVKNQALIISARAIATHPLLPHSATMDWKKWIFNLISYRQYFQKLKSLETVTAGDTFPPYHRFDFPPHDRKMGWGA
jgi:hypothetical protein